LAQAEKIDFRLTAPIAVANLRRHYPDGVKLRAGGDGL
jgi:hypothetical protein